MKRRVKKNKKLLIITAAVLLSVLIAVVTIWIASVRASRAEIITEVNRFALKHKLPAALVCAVIEQESSFNPFARGRAGEIGLMQLMPPGTPGAPEEWARIHRVKCPPAWKLYRIDMNINIGCWYLARALKKWRRYRCGTELALIEYNAGAKNANLCKPDTFDGEVIPRIKIVSTRKYVTAIMKNYRENQR
ncbi:MAG: lytic transglycosylase domain-containing protein [Lentisphaerae bacterium]|nr:lytic transglycosylase domain-containing protein [Lentisphaerota bacterium]